MHVVGTHVYPVKSCYRVDTNRVEVNPWGLAGDRRWMVVDAEGRAITQRDHAELTRVRPELTDDGIVLRTPGQPDLAVPEPRHGELTEVTVWRFTGKAALADPSAHEWFTALLGRPARLVWLDDPTRRPVDPVYARPEDRVSFADGFPLLLANAASLRALNDLILESGSLEGPLPMTRFRPNVVIDGGPPWVEDTWIGRRIRIGEVTFRVPKPCARCVVTTTDQETGERGREPLLTLGRHRNINHGLLFAVNLIPDNAGVIGVGDEVQQADG